MRGACCFTVINVMQPSITASTERGSGLIYWPGHREGLFTALETDSLKGNKPQGPKQPREAAS